jgi:hypothetical protein
MSAAAANSRREEPLSSKDGWFQWGHAGEARQDMRGAGFQVELHRDLPIIADAST